MDALERQPDDLRDLATGHARAGSSADRALALIAGPSLELVALGDKLSVPVERVSQLLFVRVHKFSLASLDKLSREARLDAMEISTHHTAAALLNGRTVEQLKSDYRETRRQELAGDPDANEARRLITIALIRKIGRGGVAAFERTDGRIEASS